MLLFFTNNVSLSPGCRFAVSLFQRITSLMFTPWRLAMLESESPLRTRYVMLSLLFASRGATACTNRQTLAWLQLYSAQFVPPRRKIFGVMPRREAILESVSPERTV